LIDFLSPLYPNIEVSRLQSLSACSYKYFKFLLSFDDFIDSRNDASEVQLTKLFSLKDGFTHYEQSICGLAYLFTPESSFWQLFKKCKDAYFKTILSEKQLSSAKLPIDEPLFEQLAKGKSAICLNAVYAIQVLADNYDLEEKLIELINEIHIAFQLLDDIDDFKKDIHENQWTYPQYLLQEYLAKNNIKEVDNALKHKYLYISGIAEANMQKAVTYFKNAKCIAEDLQLSSLENYIQKQIGNTQFHKQEIKLLQEKARLKAQKSQVFVENNDLDKSINSGIKYLELNLENDFTWSDFMTSAGAGKAWITGFVGMNLAEIDKELPFLKNVANKIQENPNDFLSYNQSIFQDGDSTNFLVGFLQQMNLPNQEIEQLWQKFMNADGGWVTYRDAEGLYKRLELPEEISVDAWLTPKLCVSAVACYVLGFSENRPLFEKTADFLIKNIQEGQRSAAHWKSYWWTSSVYATSYAILALSHSIQHRKYCQKPVEWLVNQQTESGFWINPRDKQANAFYTSLALKALIIYDKDAFSNEIQNGINWLLNTQTQDGSWQTNRILQIPATDVTHPENVSVWRNSSFSVNCVTDDHNRVFTTSAVVNCLATFKKRMRC
jgi:hypothetical protein